MTRQSRRGERGVALPTPVVLLSIVAVVVAVVAFVLTNGGGDDQKEITPAASDKQPVASPSAQPTRQAKPKPKPKPVDRDKTYVEVFNNTNIRGLASTVASKASTIGWNVVGADNWMGTVPETTVYYPPKLHRAAKQLALDLGIKRLHTAEGGSMKGDRLTVIVTAPLG